MNTTIIFKDEFGPLGQGEQIIQEYFVDNTTPKFEKERFFKLLFPLVLPAFKYLITVISSKVSARVVVTNRRLAFESILKSWFFSLRDVFCVDINQISTISCDYSSCEKIRGAISRLFGKKDEKQFFLDLEIASREALLFSEPNILTLKLQDSLTVPSSENLVQELSGLVYKQKENLEK